MRWGGIEAGGTKFVLGVGGDEGVEARAEFPTREPEMTLATALDWLNHQGPIDALGIASFGPVQLDPAATNWGFITHTTKPGWSGCDFAGRFQRALGRPVGFDTDVNGAARGEALWGAAAGCARAVYVTVGTGIGGGLFQRGETPAGPAHAEMGHVRAQRHPDDRDFPGICPFHKACYEGLVSGPAIFTRWGRELSALPPDGPEHALIAFYLGQFAVMVDYMLTPDRIIFGGGVLKTPGLLSAIRREAMVQAAGFGGRSVSSPIQGAHDQETDAPDFDRCGADTLGGRIVAPGLGDDSGLRGAFALARAAYAAQWGGGSR